MLVRTAGKTGSKAGGQSNVGWAPGPGRAADWTACRGVVDQVVLDDDGAGARDDRQELSQLWRRCLLATDFADRFLLHVSGVVDDEAEDGLRVSAAH